VAEDPDTLVILDKSISVNAVHPSKERFPILVTLDKSIEESFLQLRNAKLSTTVPWNCPTFSKFEQPLKLNLPTFVILLKSILVRFVQPLNTPESQVFE
jgi:hypothetical protein